MFRTRCFALSAFTTVLLFPNWLAAATKYVDQNHPNCCLLPSCSGTSAAPFCRIEDAVAFGVVNDGDTVLVFPGTYVPGQPVGYKVDTTRKITLVSAGTAPPLDRALQTTILATVSMDHGSEGPGRRVEGFTITSPNQPGAVDGILLSGRAAQIVGNRITGNQGKGIDIIGNDDFNTPSQITGNIVSGNHDTGIYIEGADATVAGSTISGNGDIGPDGGGIYFLDSNSTIKNCMISGNIGSLGGGIRINGGAVQIVSCNIMGNHASVGTGNGGGVYAKNPGTLWLVNTYIHDNDASLNGGGAFFQGLEFSTAGADTCLPANAPLQVHMQNCLVTCNEANAGAGIFVAAGTLAEVVNSDIVSNATVPGSLAEAGGGIRIEGSCAKVYNSILWKNQDNAAPFEHQFSMGSGGNAEIGWSIVEGGVTCVAPFAAVGQSLSPIRSSWITPA